MSRLGIGEDTFVRRIDIESVERLGLPHAMPNASTAVNLRASAALPWMPVLR